MSGGEPVEERGFGFLRKNRRPGKPRQCGLTEIRGTYYSIAGRRYLEDLFELAADSVDSLKYAGGSFILIPPEQVRLLNDLCHRNHILVSTGGFIEYVLTQGREAVRRYLRECRELGFDIVEISAGFITIPTDDWLRLIDLVREEGLKPKPEIGIQFGAGGGSATAELAAEVPRDADWVIGRIERFLEAGVEMVMIESEGITENVEPWRTEIPAKLIHALGPEHLMFEAADPEVFSWYIKNYGPEVNLFVDHSQIIQLEALRAGIWGTRDLWGRVLTFPDQGESRPL